MSKKKAFVLSRDGKELFKGTHNECFEKLLDIQCASVHHAIKHEGYKIKELGK